MIKPHPLTCLFSSSYQLTKLTPEQCDYLSVTAEGPFKAEAYRY